MVGWRRKWVRGAVAVGGGVGVAEGGGARAVVGDD